MSNKTVGIGFLLLAGGLFHFLFSLVARLMEKDIRYASIESIWGLEWIDYIPISSVQPLIVSVATMQLYVIFLVSGVGLILLSTLQKH